MTNEQAVNMLNAKLECLKRETSGTDFDCNNRNCFDCSLCYEQGNMGEQKEALDMAIKALEQTTWIPVSERLPEPKETENLIAKYYLIQNEYGDMMVARWDGNGWEQMYQHEYLEDDVIAWMPLPKEYKTETESE